MRVLEFQIEVLFALLDDLGIYVQTRGQRVSSWVALVQSFAYLYFLEILQLEKRGYFCIMRLINCKPAHLSRLAYLVNLVAFQ